MIKTIAIGHLGNDATINSINGQTVINFSVAHTEKYRDAQGNQRENTIWVACSYWTEKTLIAQYLKKGVQVYVDGKPSLDTYANRENKIMPQLRLRVNAIQLLGNNNRTDQRPQGGQVSTPADVQNEPVDDLPF